MTRAHCSIGCANVSLFVLYNNVFIIAGLLEAHAVAPCHSRLDPRVTELVVDLSARHIVDVGGVTINVFTLAWLLEVHAVAPCHSGRGSRVTELVVDATPIAAKLHFP